MKKQYKSIAFLLCMMLSMAAVIGCSGGNTSTSTDTTSPANTDAAQNTEKKTEEAKDVEITWWNFPTWDPVDGEVGKYEKQIIAAFNEKYPNIKVNLEMISFEGGPEKINVAIASKTAPDLLYDAPGRILDYGKKGLLAPLNDMIDDNFKKDVSEAIWAQSMVGNDVVMYPVNTTPFMMAVNKTLFESIGALDLLPLDRPERTWTIAEYEKALQAVKDKAPGVFPSAFFAKSQAGDQGTRAYLANLAGTTFLNDTQDQIALDTDSGVAALQWVIDGVKKGLVAPGAESLAAADTMDLFLQGKVATYINYSTVVKKTNSSKKTSEFEEVFVAWPTPDGKNPRFEPYLGGMAVFNNGDADKVDAAKKLVDFIANDAEWGMKNLKATGGLSVRDSITGLYDDEENKYAESMRKYITTPPTIADGYIEMRTVWFPQLQRALMGQATAKEALDTFAQQANEIFAKAKQK